MQDFNCALQENILLQASLIICYSEWFLSFALLHFLGAEGSWPFVLTIYSFVNFSLLGFLIGFSSETLCQNRQLITQGYAYILTIMIGLAGTYVLV